MCPCLPIKNFGWEFFFFCFLDAPDFRFKIDPAAKQGKASRSLKMRHIHFLPLS